MAKHHDALLEAADAIRDGLVVAVKGIGGFHLMVDACSEGAVLRLRRLKKREEKPLAVMFPSLKEVIWICHVADIEKRLLTSPESPIVLLRRKIGSGDIADSVAPGNPNLGVLLPYSPLHHILMAKLGIPIVATSGNLSEEPICVDEREAMARLGGIADLFLIHDRPIARPVDDSVTRIMAGREAVIRRARGYAPMPIHVNHAIPKILAVGGHLKNTVAIAVDQEIFPSQHIGDLENVQTYEVFEKTIESFRKLYEFDPEAIICDEHPGYMSTNYAMKSGLPVQKVQHHQAHILACMAENELSPPLLGVAWDGTGYGLDGTIWGGEFFGVTEEGFKRAAYFKPFRLPGGEMAIKEPRRTAIGLLFETFGDRLADMKDLKPIRSFLETEYRILTEMLEKGINSPFTTSAGRLFDAIASIIGVRQETHYEGQAAMELEFALDPDVLREYYKFELDKNGSVIVIDWRPMIAEIIADLKMEITVNLISAKFHNAMAEIIVSIAKSINERKVVLSGGCFQNKYLVEKTIARLNETGFQPYWHQRVPPNDGGIALGQIMAEIFPNRGK